MPDQEHREIYQAIVDARRHRDPAQRLKALATLEACLVDALGVARAHKAATVLDLHEGPRLSWSEIGDLLGVSGERARQIAEGAR